tara:strand:- start:3987 stop:5075 length:1089 start_codon:yes stop_codon:yes gene_type:complete
MKKWTTKELIEQHKQLLLDLAVEEGKSIVSIADYITDLTGKRCTKGIMNSIFIKLKISERRRLLIEDVTEEGEKEIPIEALIKERVAAYNRKEQRYKKHYRTIKLKAEPIGLLIFGDPHVDNEGCDWPMLYEHIKLAQATEGILAVSVGDQMDNWVGRLGRLYSNASMLASDGWRLSEWMFSALQWLAVIGGNHDSWASSPGIDPMTWLTKKCGVQFYCNDELKINMTWKDRPDLEPVLLYLRHFFRGQSWYHPTHGSLKEGMFSNAHILASGHVHNWAYLQTEMRQNRITHCLSLRGYKRFDAFAKQKGFYEQQTGYSALVVIDPLKEDHRINVFWDIKEGCQYLTFLREKQGVNDVQEDQ